jgi:hypothetical protein
MLIRTSCSKSDLAVGGMGLEEGDEALLRDRIGAA